MPKIHRYFNIQKIISFAVIGYPQDYMSLSLAHYLLTEHLYSIPPQTLFLALQSNVHFNYGWQFVM